MVGNEVYAIGVNNYEFISIVKAQPDSYAGATIFYESPKVTFFSTRGDAEVLLDALRNHAFPVTFQNYESEGNLIDQNHKFDIDGYINSLRIFAVPMVTSLINK